MTAVEGARGTADLVLAARAGDPTAWAELVGRFQDTAVALAVGGVGLADAEDAAQEAFVLAFRNLGALRDPEAFPGWMGRLVRTACARRRRRPVDTPVGWVVTSEKAHQGPGWADEAAAEARQVHQALEALPVPDRTVIALHYLAGLTYPRIAEFVGISPSAAKKRAFAARRRLKEILPMATDSLSDHRPSRTDSFRDTIVLFAGIRDRDHAVVAGLLAKDPDLVHATEDWTVDEAIDAQLGVPQKASPLIRAAQTGDVELVRMLVEAGASPGGRCECAGAETALWSAVVFGHRPAVEYLLGAGADPDVAAFAGITPLHAAAQRGRDDLFTGLVAAGADPARTDGHGRRPADWRELRRSTHHRPAGDGMVVTGIRAIDLFAPIRRGGLVYWPPAYALGQAVTIFQIADHLAAEFWIVGFSYGGYEAAHIAHGSEELGVGCHIRLVDEHSEADAKRNAFERALHDIGTSPAAEKLVVCQEAPGYRHDITAALPALAGDPTVLTTFVVTPFTGEDAERTTEPPEGFDAQVGFCTYRARRGLYPAIDPDATTSRWWPSDRHRDLAERVRTLLASYSDADATLELPDPAGMPDPASAARAQQCLRWLAQPYRVAEAFTSLLGECTPVDETLASAATILNG